MATIDLKNINKIFQQGDREVRVLRDVSLTLSAGETASLLGPSGSGKTTLLGLCAGLDLPTSGSVWVDGVDLTELNEEERARFRRKNMGFVFQSFRLIPTLTALENVAVPLELAGDPEASSKAEALLKEVGLADRVTHYPSQLSGGEQQRVGVARAFAARPRLLLADEPTGNLDAENDALITDLLFNLNEKEKTTLLIVTHNPEMAQRTNKIFTLKNGELLS